MPPKSSQARPTLVELRVRMTAVAEVSNWKKANQDIILITNNFQYKLQYSGKLLRDAKFCNVCDYDYKCKNYSCEIFTRELLSLLNSN